MKANHYQLVKSVRDEWRKDIGLPDRCLIHAGYWATSDDRDILTEVRTATAKECQINSYFNSLLGIFYGESEAN